MNVRAYLFTVNKNRSYRLNPDELKDVQQETEITISQKDYNDQLTRLTSLDHYRRAVNKKIQQEQVASEQAYFNEVYSNDDTEQEIHQQRAARIKSLDLTPIQKKIVKLLVEGFEYKEIRKKLRLSSKQLRDHCREIKKKNQAK